MPKFKAGVSVDHTKNLMGKKEGISMKLWSSKVT